MLLAPLALALLVAAEPHAPPLVHGGRRAPASWAALVRGQLWICWQQDARCWRRIELDADHPDARAGDFDDDTQQDLELEPESAEGDTARPHAPNDLERLAFSGPDELLAVDASGIAWRLRRDDQVLRPIDADAVPLEAELAKAPRRLACSPTGLLPVRDAAGWRWVAAPCRAAARVCARPAPTLGGPPRATGIRVGFAISLGLARARDRGVVADRSARDPTRRDTAAVEVLASLSLAFDARAGAEHRRRWRALQRAMSTPVELPAIAEGLLADTELAATHAAVCRTKP